MVNRCLPCATELYVRVAAQPSGRGLSLRYTQGKQRRADRQDMADVESVFEIVRADTLRYLSSDALVTTVGVGEASCAGRFADSYLTHIVSGQALC